MDRRYPTVQLVAGERGLELRLVAHLMGDDHDMTGDEAGTWLMSLWERVRSAAGLLSEYGIVAPIAAPGPMVSLPQVTPSDTPPGGEDQREGQTPALDGHARIGSPTERAQKGQADRAKILQAMRTRPGRWTAHQVLLATGLSTSAVSWQLRHLKRSGLLRLEQTPGLGRSGCAWVLTEATGEAGEAESDDQPHRAVDIGAANRAKGEAKRAALLALMNTAPAALWSWAQLRDGTGMSDRALGAYLGQLVRRGQAVMIHDPANGPRKRWRLVAGTPASSSDTFLPGKDMDAERLEPDGARPGVLEHEAREHEAEEGEFGEPRAREPEATDHGRLPAPFPRAAHVAHGMDVRQIQEHSAGKVFLMLGGTPRRETAEAIRVALKLKELRWPELRDSRDLPMAMKEINRGDVAMVLVNRFNRRCSRLYGHEARLIGKPIVIIPKGYGLIQVVHSIIDQWPPQWCRSGLSPSGGIATAVPTAAASR